jgi:hypothetical protein
MSYSLSPRPTFERTTAIPYASVTRFFRDDAEAGDVTAANTIPVEIILAVTLEPLP